MGTVWCKLGPRASVWILLAAVLACAITGCSGEPPPPPNTISIDSAPEQGAEVFLAGKSWGVTPVVIEGIPAGYHEVVLRKELYKTTSQQITVPEEGSVEVVVDMPPLVGTVNIESKPRGARVYFNEEGEPAGETPIFRVPLPVGAHTYRLELPNHYSVNSEIEVEEDFQYEFFHELQPMEATLSVLSRPTGAQIWLNNQPQRERTPATFKVPPGLYVVSVYADGYVQQDEKLTLEPEEERRISMSLTRGNVPQGMVFVEGKEFQMGADDHAPDEEPLHAVRVDSFYIDKYEVTNAEFQEVFPDYEFPEGQEQFPAREVSWNQASEYAKRIGKRLPTEAEWELAARGDDGRIWPWGNAFESEFTNSFEFGARGPMRVGLFFGGVSPYGCMDMAGNVYEWTSTWYDIYPGNQKVTKEYGQIYRVLRGGSYKTPSVKVRCAARHFDRMDAKHPDYGFRCALDAK